MKYFKYELKPDEKIKALNILKKYKIPYIWDNNVIWFSSKVKFKIFESLMKNSKT